MQALKERKQREVENHNRRIIWVHNRALLAIPKLLVNFNSLNLAALTKILKNLHFTQSYYLRSRDCTAPVIILFPG